jgi:hypothetical protein
MQEEQLVTKQRTFENEDLCELQFTEPTTKLNVYSVYSARLVQQEIGNSSVVGRPFLMHFGLSTITSIVCGGCHKHIECAGMTTREVADRLVYHYQRENSEQHNLFEQPTPNKHTLYIYLNRILNENGNESG